MTVDGDEYLTSQVDHLLEHDGCRLLQVGQETSHGPNGERWQRTSAVVAIPAS
jgi:hypothetical protein